jgi:hypothetical protein
MIKIKFDVSKSEHIDIEFDGSNITLNNCDVSDLIPIIEDLDQAFDAIIFILKRQKGFALAKAHNKEQTE